MKTLTTIFMVLMFVVGVGAIIYSCIIPILTLPGQEKMAEAFYQKANALCQQKGYEVAIVTDSDTGDYSCGYHSNP